MKLTVTTANLQPGDVFPGNAWVPGSTVRSVTLSQHPGHYWVKLEIHQTLSPEPFIMTNLCRSDDEFKIERG